MSIYKAMVEAGVEISNHYSDLYVPVNPTTIALLADYKFKTNVQLFKCQITGLPYYDIPFAYEPYWEARMK